MRAQNLMATLIINRSDSRCGACNKGAYPQQTHHIDVAGWTPQRGGGCGAEFTEMTSDYIGLQQEQAMMSLRPDLDLICWDTKTLERRVVKAPHHPYQLRLF